MNTGAVTMQFTKEFLYAFNHSMIFEVGGFWNPNDPEVIAGLSQTKEQRRKVGYVNIPQDRGGLTKYGVAQNANPRVDVQNLNLAGAMRVYFDSYWTTAKCAQIPYPVQIMHFDAAVNHGVGTAAKMLQEAVGVTADGAIGPATLSKMREIPPVELINRLNAIRVARFNRIVQRNPSQQMFLRGWLNRAAAVHKYTLAQLARQS